MKCFFSPFVFRFNSVRPAVGRNISSSNTISNNVYSPTGSSACIVRSLIKRREDLGIIVCVHRLREEQFEFLFVFAHVMVSKTFSRGEESLNNIGICHTRGVCSKVPGRRAMRVHYRREILSHPITIPFIAHFTTR